MRNEKRNASDPNGKMSLTPMAVGGTGNDTVHVGTEVATDQLYELGETQDASGNRGDWLDAGADDDTLAGEGGDDVMDGGGADETLLGGASIDILCGGADDEILHHFKSRSWRHGDSTMVAANDTVWRNAA